MDAERLKPILEAALLASPQPLTPTRLAELFDEIERPGADAIAQALHALAQDCEGRGIELVEVGSGFRYQVRADVFPHISALWTERQTRYSRALLETISLIAYRQPITRGEIEQIRGVAVATSILRTLEEREWVRVVGHRDVPGRPALYGTTRAFLDYFQLASLDELPPLSALRDLDTLEPELALEIDAPRTTIDTAAAGAAGGVDDASAPGGSDDPGADVRSVDEAPADADRSNTGLGTEGSHEARRDPDAAEESDGASRGFDEAATQGHPEENDEGDVSRHPETDAATTAARD